MHVRTTKFLTLGAVVLLIASISAAPAPRALPGDLPVALSQMTSAELFEFGAGLRFDNGPVQDRGCMEGPCLGRIDAVRDQTPGAGSISGYGTIVARLVNLGGNRGNEGPENRYQTGRGQQVFYLMALKQANGWSWTVREAARGARTTPRETASGAWTVCRHDPATENHPKGRSRFASCAASAGAGDPGWLSCSDGCCTAGQ